MIVGGSRTKNIWNQRLPGHSGLQFQRLNEFQSFQPFNRFASFKSFNRYAPFKPLRHYNQFQLFQTFQSLRTKGSSRFRVQSSRFNVAEQKPVPVVKSLRSVHHRDRSVPIVRLYPTPHLPSPGSGGSNRFRRFNTSTSSKRFSPSIRPLGPTQDRRNFPGPLQALQIGQFKGSMGQRQPANRPRL